MRPLLRAVPVLLVLASLAMLFAPNGANTLPLYAARTGLKCQNCHFDPNGGGPRNDFGFMFARQRHSLTPEDTTSRWATLDLTNKVGDRFPLFIGVNQRFMALTNSSVTSDSLDRFGFYNMENAIHLAFQPHDRLTLVYTRDGFDRSSTTQDAWGMISGLPYDGYVRAGRFRNPFGLRMDDHTVATRNGFLDLQPFPDRFLPFDPRTPDMGVEVGANPGDFFGRMAITNGGVPNGATPFGSQYAQAFSAKVGVNMPWYQGQFSFYDDFRDDQRYSLGAERRVTRWGYAALGHWHKLQFVGEIAAGTDLVVADLKRNSLAGFAELNYTPNRWSNYRVRFDYLDLDRSNAFMTTPFGPGAPSLWRRYSIEGEFLPVPFGEIRWTYRLLQASEEMYSFAPVEIPDERQAYVQFHFSY
jgi:hypothetical protein